MSKSQYTFSAVPTVKHSRSRFDLGHEVKTTMSVGKLYPIDCLEVLPGDTFKVNINALLRISSAFLRPVMDNAYMDVYSFFVPLRLCYNRLEETFGENKQGPWASNNLPAIPTTDENYIVIEGTVADYLGLPVGQMPSGLSILPFRAFALIWDRWFRNENTVAPMQVQLGEFNSNERFNSSPWGPNNYTGQLPYVGKRKDYFTACLPAPQKGGAVTLNLGNSAPVRNSGTTANLFSPIWYGSSNQILSSGDPSHPRMLGVSPSTGPYAGQGTSLYGFPSVTGAIDANGGGESSLSLIADLSAVTGFNINDLRFAFQLQKRLERDARSGTRYYEYIQAAFNVSNPDARMQIPEFLAGKRIPINVQSVAQTNTQQEDEDGAVQSPLASLGATSISSLRGRYVKSFTEHGYIITVACIRVNHTYQQGINRMYFRATRDDFYDPLFSTLGEQPVYSQQLFASSSNGLKQNVFGYNEYGAEYRYQPNIVTGQMRSNNSAKLDIWHFADVYQNAPVLGEEFTNETPQFFDRTVAVPSTSQDNFIVDFYFDTLAYRCMPMYSIPGLIDHH